MTRNHDIRSEIVLQLYAARPLKMSVALLGRQARKAGLDFTDQEMRAEVEFLFESGLISSFENQITGERMYWISPKGVLQHENQ